jgi:hypothetical protein
MFLIYVMSLSMRKYYVHNAIIDMKERVIALYQQNTLKIRHSQKSKFDHFLTPSKTHIQPQTFDVSCYFIYDYHIQLPLFKIGSCAKSRDAHALALRAMMEDDNQQQPATEDQPNGGPTEKDEECSCSSSSGSDAGGAFVEGGGSESLVWLWSVYREMVRFWFARARACLTQRLICQVLNNNA